MPSIEDILLANIAATEKLTSVMEKLLAVQSGAETPKTKTTKATPAPKAAEPVVVETPTAAPEPEPEHAAEETPAAEQEPEGEAAPAFPTDRDAALAMVSEHMKAVLRAAGPGEIQKKKDIFTALRTKWGITKVAELADDKLEQFYNETVAVLA